MGITKHLKNYLSLSGGKSGFLMVGGECRYLFGNRLCSAKCELMILTSESAEIVTQYHDELLVIMREGEPSVYISGKRVLRITELFLMYSVHTGSGQIFGVISGGNLPSGDVRFSEPRLCEMFKAVFSARTEQNKVHSDELNELKRLLDSNEIKELNRLYLVGKPIAEEE